MAISTIVLPQGDGIRILQENNVLAVSVQAPTGSCFSVLGTEPLNLFYSCSGGAFSLQQVAIDKMTLSNGEGFTVTAFNAGNPLDALTICAVGGSINVLVQQ